VSLILWQSIRNAAKKEEAKKKKELKKDLAVSGSSVTASWANSIF
jgi:hypothetical protein